MGDVELALPPAAEEEEEDEEEEEEELSLVRSSKAVALPPLGAGGEAPYFPAPPMAPEEASLPPPLDGLLVEDIAVPPVASGTSFNLPSRISHVWYTLLSPNSILNSIRRLPFSS